MDCFLLVFRACMSIANMTLYSWFYSTRDRCGIRFGLMGVFSAESVTVVFCAKLCVVNRCRVYISNVQKMCFCFFLFAFVSIRAVFCTTCDTFRGDYSLGSYSCYVRTYICAFIIGRTRARYYVLMCYRVSCVLAAGSAVLQRNLQHFSSRGDT